MDRVSSSTLAAVLLAQARLQRQPARRYPLRHRRLLQAQSLELLALDLQPRPMRASHCLARGWPLLRGNLLALLIRSGFSRSSSG